MHEENIPGATKNKYFKYKTPPVKRLGGGHFASIPYDRRLYAHVVKILIEGGSRGAT